MRGFLNKTIKIGDEVIFVSYYDLDIGVVEELDTKLKQVRIKSKTTNISTNVKPNRIIKK